MQEVSLCIKEKKTDQDGIDELFDWLRRNFHLSDSHMHFCFCIQYRAAVMPEQSHELRRNNNLYHPNKIKNI